MTQNEIKALIEDLRLNHEFCPKEVILQAADELERMQQGIEVMRELHEAKDAAVRTERQRIVNLLMIQHEAAKGSHNYWHVAANLIQAEVASDT
jgi:hypothetical protein